MRKAWIGVVAILSAFLSAAQAQELAPAVACADAVATAESRHVLPAGLLGAIARVESGRRLVDGRLAPWPWTIDADGHDYVFATRAEAVAKADALLAHGTRQLDAGCLQVNLQSHPSAFATLDDAFDPARNADYAARFLRTLHDGPAAGDWAVAAGFYHSQFPQRAEAYRARLLMVLAGRPAVSMPAPGRAPLALRAASASSGRFALPGGAVRVDVAARLSQGCATAASGYPTLPVARVCRR